MARAQRAASTSIAPTLDDSALRPIGTLGFHPGGPTAGQDQLETPHVTGTDHSGSEPAISAVLVLEQTLGHITHTQNLERLIDVEGGSLRADFVKVEFDTHRRIPGWSNWTVRAGIRAHRGLRRNYARRGRRPDVMFVHTQVPAVLLGRWMRRVPTIVSIDATPEQYDSLGDFYAHERGPAWAERLKHEANRRCFARAAHLVTWSSWARQGLVDRYGVAPERVSVIAPGVDVGRWACPDRRASPDRAVRLLFVGNDLHRKGADILIESVRRLRADTGLPEVELHLVSNAPVEPEPGVMVHRGLTANSPELQEQYQMADLFCLPTRGDCLPMVLAEAAATGLGLVSTDVGAISEIVRPGITGELVPPGDADALTAVLRELVLDGDTRRRYGVAARALAEREHDACANSARLAGLMTEVACDGRRA